MADKPFSLQDHFLNTVRRAKTPVALFLMKGVKLQGIVVGFDSFSLLLRRDGVSQLVYKHSISTIMPLRPLDPPDELGARGGEGQRGRPSLQDNFLAAAARERDGVTVFLVNGVMLEGRVEAFDQFSLLLVRGPQVQLVYKHAVSTIQPEKSLTLDGAVADHAEPVAG